MACAITITSVVGIGTPPTSIVVQGTATDCPSVRVTLQCSSAATATLVVPVDVFGNWVATFTSLGNLGCVCTKPYSVQAECDVTTDCTAATSSGPLQCQPGTGCPIASVTVTELECTTDGLRTVQLDAAITTSQLTVTQWDFGDNTFGPASSLLNYAVTHDYATPGPYTATLIVIIPPDCPPAAIVGVGPLQECDQECSEAELNVVVEGCAGPGGQSALAAFTVTLMPPTTGCTFLWDFGDGNTLTTLVPGTTHIYTTPGDFAVSVAVVCGACVTPVGVTAQVPACCPVLDTLTASVDGCVNEEGEGNYSVTWVATTDPAGLPGSFQWSYADGVSAATTAPTHSRTHQMAQPPGVTVSYTPEMQGCAPTTLSASTTVPQCTDDSGCFDYSIVIAIAGALLLALGMVAIVIQACLGLPIPGLLLGLIIGFAVVIAVTYIICALSSCPCPTACQTLRNAWIAALAAAVVALYFTGCCPGWWWLVVLGLWGGAGTALLLWVRTCSPSECEILSSVGVALTSGAGTLWTIIDALGPLEQIIEACAWNWVRWAAAGAAIIFAGWAWRECTRAPGGEPPVDPDA
jgi:hypothetical protein